MQIEAEQRFELPYPAQAAGALAFVQDPQKILAHLPFLHHLRTEDQAGQLHLHGKLSVLLAVMGQIDLPFHSLLSEEQNGASLQSQPISEERAWVEVRGWALLRDEAQHPPMLDFEFRFTAHLQLPDQEGWGGAAFEKMVQAAAKRTLERMTRELPQGIQRAIQADIAAAPL